MKFEKKNQPEATILKIYLEQNESFITEPGAMIGMSSNIKLESKTAHGKDAEAQEKSGSLSKLSKLGKQMLAGESLFKTKFTAENGPGEILISQDMPGDIECLPLSQEGLYLNNGTFIGSTIDVKMEGSFGGLKSFIGAGSLAVLKMIPLSDNQYVAFGSYGTLEVIECDGSIIIDNEHLVAWETTLNYNVTKATSGLVATYLSGEGFVCSFTGSGKVWIQTRNPTSVGQTLGSLLSS